MLCLTIMLGNIQIPSIPNSCQRYKPNANFQHYIRDTYQSHERATEPGRGACFSLRSAMASLVDFFRISGGCGKNPGVRLVLKDLPRTLWVVGRPEKIGFPSVTKRIPSSSVGTEAAPSHVPSIRDHHDDCRNRFVSLAHQLYRDFECLKSPFMRVCRGPCSIER